MYTLYIVGSTSNPYLKDINHNKDIDVSCIVSEGNMSEICCNVKAKLLASPIMLNNELDFRGMKSTWKDLLCYRYQMYYMELMEGQEIKEFRDQYQDVLNYPDDIFNKEMSKYFKEFCTIFNRVPYKLYIFLMNYYIRKNKSFDLTKEQIDDIRYIYSCVSKESFNEKRYQDIFNMINNIWGK